MLKPIPFAVLALLGLSTPSVSAQTSANGHITIAIGQPGSENFVFGTELWALSQIALKPTHGLSLATIEADDDRERLDLLRDARAEVAVIEGRREGSDSGDIRTVMTLWPDGADSGAEAARPAQILARKQVPDDAIYHLTRAIFENPGYFGLSSKAAFGAAKLERAVAGADWPIHPGASRYYREEGLTLEGSDLQASAESAVFYAHFDAGGLDADERGQIAAACRHALEMGVLSAVLGDLSARGCEVYQDFMAASQADQRRRYLENAGVAFTLSEIRASGQGGPAIALDEAERADQPPTTPDHHRIRKSGGRQPVM